MSKLDPSDAAAAPTASAVGADVAASDGGADPTTTTGPIPIDGADRFGEIREAAGAVVASLKWFLEATERVLEDPDAFAEAAAKGRSVVEAFTAGFLAQSGPERDGEDPGEAARGEAAQRGRTGADSA